MKAASQIYVIGSSPSNCWKFHMLRRSWHHGKLRALTLTPPRHHQFVSTSLTGSGRIVTRPLCSKTHLALYNMALGWQPKQWVSARARFRAKEDGQIAQPIWCPSCLLFVISLRCPHMTGLSSPAACTKSKTRRFKKNQWTCVRVVHVLEAPPLRFIALYWITDVEGEIEQS